MKEPWRDVYNAIFELDLSTFHSGFFFVRLFFLVTYHNCLLRGVALSINCTNEEGRHAMWML